MSEEGKYRRKSVQLERRLNFLLQSFSLNESDLDSSESQMVEMDDLLQQLSRNNELLASAEPDQFPEHRQQFFFLNEQIRGIKEKITFLKGRERLLSGAAQKEEDQVSIEMKSILDARDSVHKSQTMANEFLEQTAYTKEAVMRGNDGLRRVRDKTFASTYQTVTGVLGAIYRQNTKHTIAMGLTIGLCLCFLLWWWWTKR